MAEKKEYLDNDGLLHLKTTLKTKVDTKLNAKVDKVEGMGLSHNDLTDELVEKINNAGDSSFTGDYNDLTNKPKINNVELIAGNNSAGSLGLSTTEEMTNAINTATKDMATKTYVTQQLANINKKQIVTSTTEMTDTNTIYLIANSGSGNNVYDEYIVVNGTPEKVGTTAVDLTNYVQESDLVEITNGEIDEIFADF